VERYHPYSPPSPSGDLLIVQRRPQWFPRRLSPLAAPSLGPALPWSTPAAAAKVQDQPVDFSKKTSTATVEVLPPKPAAAIEDRQEEFLAPPKSARLVSREFAFQRNLLVILIQNIRRNSAHGRRVVKFLQAACMSVGGGGVVHRGGGFRQTGQGSAATRGVISNGSSLSGSPFGGSGNNFSRSGSGGLGSGGGNSVNNNNSFSGFSGVGGGGNGSLHSSRSSSTDNEDGGSLGGFEDDGGATVDFDQLDFDFAESATRKWMAENPDLNPLKVLDHLQLRPDLTPGSGGGSEVQKPPDLASMDRDTATFLQLAVPVPDPTQTFLDIGTDFGPISMYEDDPFNLEQLVPSTFSMEPQQQQQQQQQQMQQQHQLHHHLYNDSLQKPVSIGVLGAGENLAKKYLDFGHSSQLHQHHNLHANNTAVAAVVTAFRTQQHPQEEDASSPLNRQHHLGMTTTHQLAPHNNNKTQSQQQHQQQLFEQQQQHQQMLSLDLSVKQEPLLLAPFQIKEEPSSAAAACLLGGALAEPKVCSDIMFPSPPTPTKSGGGGRKRTVSFSEEEEDLSHLPSLQMRIQVLQQRVSSGGGVQ